MRALAIQRWLWGLLVVGLLLAPGRGAAKTGPGAPPAAPAAVTLVHVAPFGAPATLPALGEELARALYAALREANIPARLGKSEEGSAISGRLEEISQTQVRLHASYRGHSVQSVGDLEHLDDLVYAVFTQLRPRLLPLSEAGDGRSGALTLPASGQGAVPANPLASPGPAEPKSPASLAVLATSAAPGEPPKAVVQASLSTPARAPAGRELDPAAAKRTAKELASEALKETPRTAATRAHRSEPYALAVPQKTAPETASLAGSRELRHDSPPTNKDGGKDKTSREITDTKDTKDAKGTRDTRDAREPGETAVAAAPASSQPDPGALPPVENYSPAPPKTPPFAFDPRRPRVAVHVVGEPIARVPPGYYGLGAVGQQTLISYLQHRWRVPALGSRLVGLTGGLPALDQSLRLGARHTLMARLDSLTLTSSPIVSPGPGPGSITAGGTLSGRIHVVLLLDGKLLLDRSVMMPPTLVLASETPAQAYSRILYAAMDSVAGELYARLVQPPPG